MSDSFLSDIDFEYKMAWVWSIPYGLPLNHVGRLKIYKFYMNFILDSTTFELQRHKTSDGSVRCMEFCCRK